MTTTRLKLRQQKPFVIDVAFVPCQFSLAAASFCLLILMLSKPWRRLKTNRKIPRWEGRQIQLQMRARMLQLHQQNNRPHHRRRSRSPICPSRTTPSYPCEPFWPRLLRTAGRRTVFVDHFLRCANCQRQTSVSTQPLPQIHSQPKVICQTLSQPQRSRKSKTLLKRLETPHLDRPSNPAKATQFWAVRIGGISRSRNSVTILRHQEERHRIPTLTALR